MRNNKGISLIVLIVTIVVIIILAAVVILTITKNNPIESAKEARFKEDIRTFQYELSLAISKNMIAADKKDEKITELDFEKIKGYISSFSEKYRDKIVIQDNELRYTDKINEKEKEWLKQLNIAKTKSILPDGYTELEYIESTGTQYIDLEQGSSKDMVLLIVAQYTNINAWQAILGSYNNRKYQLLGNNSVNFLFLQYGLTFHKYHIDTKKFKITIDFVNDIFIYDKDGYYYTENLLNWTNERDFLNNFYLFWARDVDDGRQKAKLKLYKLEIYRGEELSLNLIPSLDTQRKPCLYDTVSKKAFYNQGTGEFLYKEKE